MEPVFEAEAVIRDLQRDRAWQRRILHVEAYPAKAPRWADIDVHPQLRPLLRARGIDRLYSHQAEGIRLIRAGRNVAIATPTASGKSLTYLLPVWERRLAGDPGYALYLSPLKALAQDQRRVIEELGAHLPKAARLSAALYDGDTPGSTRTRLRATPPAILLSNPDMVHLSILASHHAWAPWLANLRTVILDEAHAYRGIFGSHVSGIVRRLKRMCARYGATPQFVATSATLRNPDEFLRRLTGEEFALVGMSGAPSSARFFALVRPESNVYTESCELLARFLDGGLKTIVFTKARKITELLAIWLRERSPAMARRVKAYRAGYLPEERRELERALVRDELAGIISTSALELGIDIGGLDGCILVGFPGTMLSTWQRAGRVGRGDRPALIALVGMEDPLDLYFLEHPLEFFGRPPERLLLDEANPAILKSHLVCAAAEAPLSPGDAHWFGPALEPLVEELLAEGKLHEGAAERKWFCPLKTPQRFVNIRSTGESYTIENARGRMLGTVDGIRAFKECHPQAIYLHAGETYEVTELNLDSKRVAAREVDVDYYTVPTVTEDTKVLKVRGERGFGPGRLAWGDVRVTARVVGYERKLVRGGVTLSQHPLTLPPHEFETVGVWLMAPPAARVGVGADRDLMGSLHALEHISIALFPLFALCDRWDLGGISTTHHADTGTATVFVYDGVPGGVGLAAYAFEIMGELMRTVAAHLEACPCEEGCPSCIHSPKCGSRNHPLDKRGALALARAFAAAPDLSDRRKERIETTPVVPAEPLAPEEPRRSESSPTQGHTLFFDLETQKLADEVGGWDRKRDMRMSVGVVYDLEAQVFREYRENEIPALLEDLQSARLVVGFNVRSFDYEVLSAYVPREAWDAIPTLDLLEAVRSRLGRRVRLDDLAKATLGKGKLADGVEAVHWFRAGDFGKLLEYCRHDVEVTRELWEFGRANGYVLFPSIQGTMKLPAGW